MKKRWRLLIAVLLSVIGAMLVSTACSDDRFKIDWKIPENTEVIAEGYEQLPGELAGNTEFSFTAKGTDGYEIDSVMINGRNASERDGKYSFTIIQNTTIEIVVKPSIESVSVTKAPQKTYYAGQKIDPADIEVTVDYAPSAMQDAVVGDYTVVYENGSAFSIGDTSFSVSYGGKRSDPVTVPAILAKVTVNPVGGVISEEFLSAWRGNGELKDFRVEESGEQKGVVSFTFGKLTKPIPLPSNEDIIFGDGSSSTLTDWLDQDGNSYSQISVAQAVSIDLHASWNAVLVNMENVELRMENGKPILALTLTANTDFEAYLFFLEGSKQYLQVGDTIEAAKGESATVKYDLSKLSSYTDAQGGTYAGAWMDIRVNTRINGVDISQEFTIDPEHPIAKIGQMIHDADWTYRLLTNEDGGDLDLKLCYRKYVYDYEATLEEKDGTVSLVLEGNFNTAIDPTFGYDGATVSVVFGDYRAEGTVKADGSWRATLKLTGINSLDAVADLITVTSKDGKTLDTRTNADDGTLTKSKFDLNGCGTLFDYYPEGQNPRIWANVLSYGDYRYTLGVDWNELWLNIVDVAHEIAVTGATVAERDGKAYFVIEGTYGAGYDAVAAKTALSGYHIDLQNNESDGGGNWDMIAIPENGLIIETGEGKFSIYIDLANAKAGYSVFAHFGGEGMNLTTENVHGDPIIVGGIRYTIGLFTGWGSNVATVRMTDAANGVVVTGATLAVKDGKPCLVIEGIYGYNFTEETIVEHLKGQHLDLQNNEADGGGNWDTIEIPEGGVTFEAKDGEFRIFVNLEKAEAGYSVFAHFGGEGMNLTTDNVHGDPITVGDKTYSIAIWTGWGSSLVTVYVREAAE